MQLTVLIPVLALLATDALARTSHPHAAGAHRRHLTKSSHHHARSVDRIVEAIDRREQVSAGKPRALAEKPKKRKNNNKKRGATGCRARTSANSTSSVASSTVASSTSTLASSTSAVISSTTTDAAVTTASSTAVETDSATSTSTTSSSDAASASASSTDSGVEAYIQVASSPSSTTSSEAAASTTSTSAAASSSTASSSSSSSSYTPNGIKAGIAGGDAYSDIVDYIGSWYDWSASPSGHSGSPIAVNMLWGAGTVDSTDAERLAAFEALSSTPDFIIGFEEPDCSTSGSSNIGVATAAALWDSTIAPWKAKGSVLVSPSMCHQAAEEYVGWLSSFSSEISTSWDITNLHINKNSMTGVQEDLDYYYNTYGKPMWITEFACVDDSTDFVPCTDQDEINTFINDIVALFESDSRVMAYHYSNGEGLGDVWPMMVDGSLTTSGQTYINAVKSYA